MRRTSDGNDTCQRAGRLFQSSEALLLGAILLFGATPDASATGGLDTPQGVTSIPFSIEGSPVMNMTSAGLGIGIGTASPSYTLDVDGSAAIGNNQGGNFDRLYLSRSDDNHFILSTGTNGNTTYFGEYNSGGITGWQFYDTAAGAVRMSILAAGNVGIGMAPSAPLDVNGGIRGSNASSIVTGGACSPEGMTGYDLTNHQPVYCNSRGLWTSSGVMSSTTTVSNSTSGNGNTKIDGSGNNSLCTIATCLSGIAVSGGGSCGNVQGGSFGALTFNGPPSAGTNQTQWEACCSDDNNYNITTTAYAVCMLP